MSSRRSFSALFDILGEFVAQGTFMIRLTVSFIVATALVILAWLDHRREELALGGDAADGR